jgi:hypothetical protein
MLKTGPGSMSAMQRRRCFNGSRGLRYKVGPFELSLDDVEHGILRGNRRRPGSFGLSARRFGSGDPRSALAVYPLEPRIHFAINRGTVGCPRVRLFMGESINEALQWAAGAFVRQDIRVSRLKVSVSAMFKRYMADFGGSKEHVLRFLCGVVESDVAVRLRSMMGAGSGYKVRFRSSTWANSYSETLAGNSPEGGL